jgi:hypothetical protein
LFGVRGSTFVGAAGGVLVTLWRDGGQRGSRRNAWAAMVADNRRARDRAEAEALLDSMRGSRIEGIEEGRQPGA